jgi:hypothetical protein
MAKPAKIKLPPIFIADTWDGLRISLSTNGTALADRLTSVTMVFHEPDSTVSILTLTSTNGGITITDGPSWQFTINPITPFPLTVGTKYWNIETTDSGGSIKTYLVGTIQILNN